MQFLPTDFTAKSNTGNLYFKIEDGETRIRFMQAPFIGWQYKNFDKVTNELLDDMVWIWTPDNDKKPPHPKAKKFLGLLIANLSTGQYHLWELDKATVIEKIFNYASNPDYGEDMLNIDFTITKKGKDKQTSYDLLPCRKNDEAKFAVVFEDYSKREKEIDLTDEFYTKKREKTGQSDQTIEDFSLPEINIEEIELA